MGVDAVALAFDGQLVFLQKQPRIQVVAFHQPLHGVGIAAQLGIEIPVFDEKVVLERNEEARAARIALPPGPPAKLVVDPATLMLLVPITYSPPSSAAPWPRRISVPRPAMLVEIVTAPRSPAWAMMAASCSSFRAFKTLCGMSPSLRLSRSDSSTLPVPTRTG